MRYLLLSFIFFSCSLSALGVSVWCFWSNIILKSTNSAEVFTPSRAVWTHEACFFSLASNSDFWCTELLLNSIFTPPKRKSYYASARGGAAVYGTELQYVIIWHAGWQMMDVGFFCCCTCEFSSGPFWQCQCGILCKYLSNFWLYSESRLGFL